MNCGKEFECGVMNFCTRECSEAMLKLLKSRLYESMKNDTSHTSNLGH